MLDASLEVRSAVVYASLIVVLVFLPVFFLDGLAGAFFRPLALAYVLAILASLVVALTVTPALSLMLLRTAPAASRRESPLVRWLQRLYARLLPRSSHGPSRPTRRSAWSPSLAACAARRGSGQEFLPNFKETRLPDALGREAGHVARGDERGSRSAASKELRAIPGVRNFGSHIGRAESPTRSSARTSPSSGSASIPDVDYDADAREDRRRSSTATPGCTATC